MSLESILKHILDEAKAEAAQIVQQAKEETAEIIQKAKEEAERLYQEGRDKEKALYEKEKQKSIVQTRLEIKKNLLAAKQELIERVFKELKTALSKTQLKKQRIAPDKVQVVAQDIDFYLAKVRPDYEAEIAKILFA
jgi:vacuolar-type H+-ATPase subunit E/Vma4